MCLLADSSGVVQERYDYDPYGQVHIYAEDGTTPRTVSSVGNCYTYTGRYWDADAGLYYYRNRWYSADLGRGLQCDPRSPTALTTDCRSHTLRGDQAAARSCLPDLSAAERQEAGATGTRGGEAAGSHLASHLASRGESQRTGVNSTAAKSRLGPQDTQGWRSSTGRAPVL